MTMDERRAREIKQIAQDIIRQGDLWSWRKYHGDFQIEHLDHVNRLLNDVPRSDLEPDHVLRRIELWRKGSEDQERGILVVQLPNGLRVASRSVGVTEFRAGDENPGMEVVVVTALTALAEIADATVAVFEEKMDYIGTCPGFPGHNHKNPCPTCTWARCEYAPDVERRCAFPEGHPGFDMC